MRSYVVVTRPRGENKELSEAIRKLSFPVFEYPTIRISKNSIRKNFLSDLKNCDWILFTSKNGVKFFIDKLKETEGGLEQLKKKRIGVVGPKTRDEAERNSLRVDFIPSSFTTDKLAEEVPVVSGQKVLLPRTNMVSPKLSQKLQGRGVLVINISIYKTDFIKGDTNKLEGFLLKDQIALLTFTSPSTVKGFIAGLGKRTRDKALGCRVLSIGPVTTKALKETGFGLVYTAETYTLEGMVRKLREVI